MPFDEATIQPGNAGITGWARDFATPIIEDVEGLSLSAFNLHANDDAIHSSGRLVGSTDTATGIENVSGVTNSIITALDTPVLIGTRPIIVELFVPVIFHSSGDGDLKLEILNRTGAVNTVLATSIYDARTVVNAPSGTATVSAGAQFVDVTHGLGATPTRVLVTPTGSPFTSGMAEHWVSNKGATTFRINAAKAGPANLDASQTFDWLAFTTRNMTYTNVRFPVFISDFAAGSYTFGVRYTVPSDSTWSVLSSGSLGALFAIGTRQNLRLNIYET